MALQSVRLRRTLNSLSSLHCSLSSPICPTFPPLPLPKIPISPSPSVQSSAFSLFQSRPFTGSRVSLSSSGKKEYRVYKEGDEITEDMVLFEGCDFNHWLITVDFPKDPRPPPEEMVATYERICAEGLGISIEEAKKKIYACSTTTYQGFQAVMTEEESEKFKDIPGVVFVLPDSYIDPQNKEYGGDKYENGVITPRPPPIQYRKGGRFNERVRPSQPRYDQQGNPLPDQRGRPQYNQQGYNQGGGNYGTPRNYPPQQNYNTPGQYQGYPQDQRGGQYQGSYGQVQQSGYPHGGQYQQGTHYPQDQRGGQYQGSYGQGQQSGNPQGGQYHQGTHYPQDQRSFQQGDQRDLRGERRNFSPTYAGTPGQDANTGFGQGYPGEGQRFSQMEQRNMQGEQANYAPMGQSRIS